MTTCKHCGSRVLIGEDDSLDRKVFVCPNACVKCGEHEVVAPSHDRCAKCEEAKRRVD